MCLDLSFLEIMAQLHNVDDTRGEAVAVHVYKYEESSPKLLSAVLIVGERTLSSR